MYNFVSSNSIVVGGSSWPSVGHWHDTPLTFLCRPCISNNWHVFVLADPAPIAARSRENKIVSVAACALANNSYLISLTVNVFRFPSKLFWESQNYSPTLYIYIWRSRGGKSNRWKTYCRVTKMGRRVWAMLRSCSQYCLALTWVGGAFFVLIIRYSLKSR